MRLAVLLAVFISSAYASWATNNPQNTVQDVSFCELANSPSAFSGKRIRVRGIYRYEFERQRLETPTCCPPSKTKIWMEITPDLDDKSLRLFRRFPKEGLVLATFVGTFETGNTYGTFGETSKLTVDRIEKVEHTAPSSPKREDPAWVPRNCESSNAAGFFAIIRILGLSKSTLESNLGG